MNELPLSSAWLYYYRSCIKYHITFNSKFVIVIVVVVIERFVIHNKDIIPLRTRTRARTVANINTTNRQDKTRQDKRDKDIVPDMIDDNKDESCCLIVCCCCVTKEGEKCKDSRCELCS